MEPRILLAFAGKMYTGKDTSADIWVKRYIEYSKYMNSLDLPVRGYQRLAFADGIKQVCKTVFNLTDDDVNTPNGKKQIVGIYGKTVRELLQGIGEGLRQSISPNIWVTRAMSIIDNTLNFTDKNIVVTDVRYINELSALKARGFTMVKLVRDTGIEDNHPSEKDLKDSHFDYIIENNGSLVDLEIKLVNTIPDYTPIGSVRA